MKTKMGRPEIPKNQQKTEFFTARLTPDEAKEVGSIIKASGLSKSDWMRQRLLSGKIGA